MAMWPYHPDLLARPVPRYTSYPTAAEYGDHVGHADMAAALGTVGTDEILSLYLHIPYCRAICWYCGCNTGAANRTARLDAYLTRLHREIDLVAARLEGRGRIGRIALGGGSPNAIPPAAFAALVAHLRAAFASDSAILSLEIDPRGFDVDWASVIADTGVARVSLGVQTFDPALQAAIGRVQPGEDIIRAVTLLRAVGVGSINFDLRYGLPGQDEATLAATLDEAIALAPERLAVFGYAHVPHLIPRQRRIDGCEARRVARKIRPLRELQLGRGGDGVDVHTLVLRHAQLPRQTRARDDHRRRLIHLIARDRHARIGFGHDAVAVGDGRQLFGAALDRRG